jgi:hypothetical protein
MLRRLMIVAAIAALVLVPQVTQAQFKAGDLTLALSGAGAHGPDLDGTTISFQGELGYFLNKNLSVSLRQGVGYTDFGAGSAWTGSTAVAADWHFDYGRWQPYIGANIGYIYGDVVDDNFMAGPEAGIKFFANATTYIQLNVAYEFFLCESLSDGQFQYSLSVGFRL